MEIVGPGRRSERTLQQIIESRAAGMENDTCGRQVFHNYARKLRLVDSGCRSDTAVFTRSVAGQREREREEREEKEREGDHLTTAKEQDERANIHDPHALGYQVRQQRWGFTRPVGRSGLLLLLAYRVVLSVPKQRLVPN